MSDFLERHPVLKGSSSLLLRYFDHRVARDSAALTYYLLFAIFPILILLGSLPGLLDLDVQGVLREFSAFMPQEIVALAEDYFAYVSAASNRTMLWFSLFFSVYAPFRAANILFLCVRKAYGLERSKETFPRYQLRVLLYTVFLIAALVLTLALSTVGRRILSFLSRYVYVSDAFLRLYTSLRFVVLGVIVFSVIALLYALALDGHREKHGIWPGLLTSMAVWLVLSMLFSLYVERVSNYSLIYGSNGTIIVLLLWLYLTATMLILGAEINALLLERRKDCQEKHP